MAQHENVDVQKPLAEYSFMRNKLAARDKTLHMSRYDGSWVYSMSRLDSFAVDIFSWR